jgi:hypothetical protein
MPPSRPLEPSLDRVTDEADRFEKALGTLMLAWADAEQELYRVLVHYAGVSDAVGRAIFSGTRARTMMDYVNNIAHNVNLSVERKENLAAVFSHMTTVNSMRDRVVHYSSGNTIEYNDPETRALSNYRRVNRYDTHFIYEIGSKHLAQMTEDLYLIGHHLQMHWTSPAEKFQSWTEEPADGSAWRCKPLPALKATRLKRRRE